jgi:hypothetical protein
VTTVFIRSYKIVRGTPPKALNAARWQRSTVCMCNDNLRCRSATIAVAG